MPKLSQLAIAAKLSPPKYAVLNLGYVVSSVCKLDLCCRLCPALFSSCNQGAAARHVLRDHVVGSSAVADHLQLPPIFLRQMPEGFRVLAHLGKVML